jgi:hypothetical protein
MNDRNRWRGADGRFKHGAAPILGACECGAIILPDYAETQGRFVDPFKVAEVHERCKACRAADEVTGD